jgi:hypothetical protein
MPPDRAKANAAPTIKRILVIVSSPDRRVTFTIWPTDRWLVAKAARAATGLVGPSSALPQGTFG